MLLRRRDGDRESSLRGQTLVEFALLLPLLVLLLVMAIDFGRVFFGWVGLHNATRIAADHASSFPDAWEPPGDSTTQAAYRSRVLNELRALNCEHPSGGAYTAATVPVPTYVEKAATSYSTASRWEVGDAATVTIPCSFQLLTPLAGIIVGNPVSISATADFMVRGGEIDGVPVGPAPPSSGCVDETVPSLIGLSVAAARDLWDDSFTGAFSPATGSDAEIVTAQTTTPASTPGDCLVATASVVVTHAPGSTCTGTDREVPSLLGLTVADARAAWTAAEFTGAFSPASGSDTDVVSAQETTPSSTPGDCRPPTITVSVTHAAPPPPQCTVPQLVGVRANTGLSNYSSAGFTGTYTITRPPSGNYVVTSQSLVFGQEVACSSNMVVAGN